MSLRHHLACCLLLSACTGGQGGDPGQAMGGGPTGPGDMGEDGYCTGERWQGPDAARLSGSCEEQTPGAFRCECGDGEATAVLHDVRAERCADALREGCAVDLQAPSFCEARAIGTCWPRDAASSEADAAWRCRCEGDEALVESDAASCIGALAAVCTERCESGFGQCAQALSAPDSYACSCTGEPGVVEEPGEPDGGGTAPIGGASAIPAVSFASCAEALATTCSERCTSAAGACAVGEDQEAFDCECSAGQQLRVTLAELGAPLSDACWRGLLLACGEELAPPISGCESSHDGHEVSCEALAFVRGPGAPPPEAWDFRCACDGAPAEPLQALTCYRALQASCPAAIPASAMHVEPGELGSLCEAAGDCDLGACYVPGNGLDPICSAGCEDDDDCPADALCAFVGDQGGHCFAVCESHVECGLRNDAQGNPLYCADRVDIDQADLSAGDESGRICVQHSEP